MRLRCEVCGGTDVVKVDGSYRCCGCGMRYDIGELRTLIALGSDEREDTRSAGGGKEPPMASGGHGPGYEYGGWSSGRGDVNEQDHGRGVWRVAAMGSPEGRVLRGPLDALPTSVLLIVGVVVFGLCFLIRRSGFNMRVIGMSLQEWLLFSYTALLIATLESRHSRLMEVLTTACAILSIVVLSLQVRAWATDDSFCLLRLSDFEAGITQEATGETVRDDGTHEATPGDLGTFEVWTVSGKGDAVVPIDCRPMPCLIDVAYAGEGDFALFSRDADGRQRDLLVDATGAYDGQVTTYGDEEDADTLEVRTEGAWELRFAPMDAVVRIDFDDAGGSEVFHGDAVVRMDEESQGTLGFAHRGEGDFTVKAVTGAGSELLIDTTGPYEGTVAGTGPGTILVVSADGDWSVSSS